MKNLVLGVVLTAFLFTAAPVHAQVSIPTDRDAIIALIEVLLKRIEEIKTEMAKAEKATKKEEWQAKERAKWQAEEREQKKDRHAEVVRQIIRMESHGMKCIVVSAKGDGIANSPDGTRWGDGNAHACEVDWANKLADLKIEKMELEAELND